MTDFYFTEQTSAPPADNQQAALGVDANNPLVDADIGKPVKLAANQNYVVCTSGDEIEGFVSSINPAPVNSGFSFGSVVRNKRKTVQVDAAELGTAAIGGYVLAGTSAALGTADTYPQVTLGSPTVFRWRIIRIVSGTGVAGDLLLVERV